MYNLFQMQLSKSFKPLLIKFHQWLNFYSSKTLNNNQVVDKICMEMKMKEMMVWKELTLEVQEVANLISHKWD